MSTNKSYEYYFTVMLIVCFLSCNSHKDKTSSTKIVENPASMNEYVQASLKDLLASASSISGNAIDDTTKLLYFSLLKDYYDASQFKPAWSDREKWAPMSDSLLNYLSAVAMYDGLFKEDYQYTRLSKLHQKLSTDSLLKKDAVQWAKADLLFSQAFFHVVQDLKQGRLQPDSVSLKSKPNQFKEVFFQPFKEFQSSLAIISIAQSLQPQQPKYIELKFAMKHFLDSMDDRNFTYLVYPYRDSLSFIKKLVTRLGESGALVHSKLLPDSLGLNEVVRKYQQKKGLKPDGKVSLSLVKDLNNTDPEKFKRIAITLDRYKELPAKMPEKYIWVNLPSYYMKVMDHDSVVLTSKIIIGKQATPTPLITSSITDMIVYPTWTIPTSIIVKDNMLAGLKKNAGYLARKGFYLLDNKGEKVDPYAVNWAKYTKNIPFRVQQGSGDDNALGVIKFNFNNPYAVYLHDTNQRYLFNNGSRSLSHGCVRVQDWQKLASYILQNDSLMAKPTDTLKANTDSIVTWIAARQHRKIVVKNKFPLFIRYFGCETINGNIKFYDDIYGNDKALREKYFAGR